MNLHNHLVLIEQYSQYKESIQSLMASMMTSLPVSELMSDRQAQVDVVKQLSRHYPFVELLYSLDVQGVQLMDSVCSPTVSDIKRRELSKGRDRNERPYMKAIRATSKGQVVTDPYLSSATHRLSISTIQEVTNSTGEHVGYLVLNFNLPRLISYLKGDETRIRIHPFFQIIYFISGALLIAVSLQLLFSAGVSLYEVLGQPSAVTASFGIVVMISLGLAIFDLGKTILEEEVLSNKDIHHHDTSRRTITRFMSAIVIAVSIESLLLMFKSLLSDGSQVISAVWMLMAAVALLAGLGVYLKLSRV